MITATLRVDSPRAALVCSRVLARRRPWRVRARAWLVAHAEASAIRVMPVALGRDAPACGAPRSARSGTSPGRAPTWSAGWPSAMARPRKKPSSRASFPIPSRASMFAEPTALAAR